MQNKLFKQPLLLVALLCFSVVCFAEDTDASEATVVPSAELTGKHVTLRYGPGFSQLSAKLIRGDLVDQGCPATLTDDGDFDNAIDIEIGDDWATFESPGSAGSYALTICKQ